MRAISVRKQPRARFAEWLANSPVSSPRRYSIAGLTRTHRLTAYDAAYLELALRENVALATLDDALMRAARSEGVVLVGENA